MLSNLEVEIPDAIDLNSNCKKVDDVNQWAVRRTRSLFSGGRKRRLVTQCSKTTNMEARRIEETPIADSEETSATTLGQHFSDSVEIVPIKKRRVLFVQSPSPMQSSALHDCGTSLDRQLPANHKPLAFSKDDNAEVIASKNTSVDYVMGEVSDAADLSGISILASAAACNSGMVGDGIDSCSLVLKGNSYENVLRENTNDDKSSFLREDKERQLQSYEDMVNDNVNIETCSAFNSSQNNSSMGSLPDVSLKVGSASLSRLHWDLNIGMDAWNCSCDGFAPEPSIITDIGNKSSKPNENFEGQETCQCGVDNVKSTCPLEFDESLANGDGIAGDKSIALEALAKRETGDTSFISNHEQDCSFPNGYSLTKEEHHLDSIAASLLNCTGKTKPPHDLGNYTCSDVVVSSTTSDVLGISFGVGGPLAIKSIDKAKANADSGLEMKTETTFSSENVLNDDEYKSHMSVPQSFSKSICDETANIIAPNAENSSADHLTTIAEELPAHLCRTKIGKHGFLSSNAVSSDGSSLNVDICRNLLRAHDMHGKTVHCDGYLDNTNHTQKSSEEVCRSPALIAHQCNSPSQFNPDELTSGVISSVTALAKADVNLVTEETTGTQMAVKSNVDNCDINLIASQINIVQDRTPEKVDFQGDDDSQFEDGEFRESFLHCWEEDGDDEMESEHVDYGSDNGENDNIETVSVIAATDSFTIENMVFKERSLADVDEAHSVKDGPVTLFHPSSKHSSKTDGPDRGQNSTPEDDVVTDHANTNEDVITDHTNQSALDLRRNKRNVIGFHGKGDNHRERSADLSTKSSASDQLLEGHRHTSHFILDREIDSVKQDVGPDTLRVFDDGESLRRFGLTFRVGLSSRVDRFKSDNKSYRKDQFFTRLSRYNGHGGLEAKSERKINAPNSVEWGHSSRHTQKRGRDEHWSDSPNCRVPIHHVSPSYYNNKNYNQSTSRNAAAAAVAKVESNGFVVSPDGTLVKANGAGFAGRLPKRFTNAFPQNAHPLSRWGVKPDRDPPFTVHRRLQNSRQMSPDQKFSFGMALDGKYAHDMHSSQRGRRMPSDRDSSQNRSLSPCRRPLRLDSHTTSPSRSRTRSPLPHASPRGRNDFVMNDVHFLRSNRFPATSGNLAFPSHASRSIVDRKDASNHLKEDRYKKYSKRSSTANVFNNRRFDSVDSQGRPNPEYYHSLQSRRKT